MTSLNNFVLYDLFVLYQCDTNAFVMDEHFFLLLTGSSFVLHCISIYFIFVKYLDNQKPIFISYIKYLNFKF